MPLKIPNIRTDRLYHVTANWSTDTEKRFTRDFLICTSNKQNAETIAKNHIPKHIITSESNKIRDIQIRVRDLGLSQNNRTYMISPITETSRTNPNEPSVLEHTAAHFAYLFGLEIGSLLKTENLSEEQSKRLSSMQQIDDKTTLLLLWATEFLYEKDTERDIFFYNKLNSLTKTENKENNTKATYNSQQFGTLLEQTKEQADIIIQNAKNTAEIIIQNAKKVAESIHTNTAKTSDETKNNTNNTNTETNKGIDNNDTNNSDENDSTKQIDDTSDITSDTDTKDEVSNDKNTTDIGDIDNIKQNTNNETEIETETKNPDSNSDNTNTEKPRNIDTILENNMKLGIAWLNEKSHTTSISQHDICNEIDKISNEEIINKISNSKFNFDVDITPEDYFRNEIINKPELNENARKATKVGIYHSIDITTDSETLTLFQMFVNKYLNNNIKDENETKSEYETDTETVMPNQMPDEQSSENDSYSWDYDEYDDEEYNNDDSDDDEPYYEEDPSE